MQRLKILLQSKLFLIISLIFISSYVVFFTKIIKYESLYQNGNITLNGKILEYKIDGDKLSIVLKAKEKINVTYYFKSLEEKNSFKDNLKLGLVIKVTGILEEPSNNTIPNTFNYKNYLYNKSIYKIMTVDKIEFLQHKISILYKIKNLFISKVETFNDSKEYIYAFILGESGYINSDVYQNYKDNGVTHLFAVSGMHVSFLILAISNFLKKLKLKDNYINLIIIVFLFMYMFLMGFTASVVRASLLYIFILINKKLNLNINNIIVLYLLFLFLLIINPFYIYDIGFIYSFLTSFGLMLFNKKITGNYFMKLLKTSTIAFLFSMPVTLYNFYEINLLTILNNIIIVPLVSVVLFPLALLTFIVPLLEPLLNFGFEILEVVNNVLNNLKINLVVPKINIIFIIIYYLGIYKLYKGKLKYALLLVLLIIVYKFLPYLNGTATIYYLDVGQGDCSLIITENRQDIVLIDTGGKIDYEKESWQRRNSNFSLANNIVTFLKSLGISKLDLLIGTHGDTDHIGYAKDIIDKIKVDNLMLNNNKYNKSETYLLENINDLTVNNYNGKNIRILNLNNLNSDDENDSSLVLYVSLRKINLLFMGDAPIKVEEDIIEQYDLNVDILKVGHHGSKTSTSSVFIDKIKPIYSVISAGKNNRYGHPNSEVLENLKSTKIYRTDLDGSVMFKIKNNELEIEICTP